MNHSPHRPDPARPFGLLVANGAADGAPFDGPAVEAWSAGAPEAIRPHAPLWQRAGWLLLPAAIGLVAYLGGRVGADATPSQPSERGASAGPAPVVTRPAPPQALPATPTATQAARPAAPQVAVQAAVPPTPPVLQQPAAGGVQALPGAWGRLDAQGRLVPDVALRQRFDGLLAVADELPPGALETYIRKGAQQSVGPAGAAQVLDVWRHYLALEQEASKPLMKVQAAPVVATAGRVPLQAQAPGVLAERQAQRLRHLGPQWTQAFFKAEDQRFEAMLRTQPTAAGVDSNLPMEGMLTPEQLQRWRQGQVEQALWEDHLRDVQEHWQGLLARKELSEAQRSQELTRFMSGFMDADDQRRTRMLLDLPQ